MKLNEVVKSRRQALGLTQEQVGDYLGVSTPAVSKWETGASFPDITLLPPLARLLGVDLNTLLSFQDSLSDQEIGHFLNALSEMMDQEGFAAGFQLAREKLQQFPGCPRLLGSVAIQLRGGLTLYGKDLQEKAAYKKEITALLERAAAGDDVQIKEQSLYALFSTALDSGETERAEALFSALPPRPNLDRRPAEARLRLAQGRREEACRALEQQLLSAATTASNALFLLLDIAAEDGRLADGQQLAETTRQLAMCLHLWTVPAIMSQLRLVQETGDQGAIRQLAYALLEELPNPWEPARSPLYRHIPVKEGGRIPGEKLLSLILRELTEEKHLSFLQEDAGFMQAVERCRRFIAETT